MGEKFEPTEPARIENLDERMAKLKELMDRDRRRWTSTGLPWTILCVAPHMERKVAAALGPKSKENPHGVGLQVYVPVETYLPKTANVARAHRPWRPRTRALIPGVIFALLPDDEALDLARGNHAVRRIMCRDGVPVKVPAMEIGTLAVLEALGAFDRTRKVSGARKGRRRGRRGLVEAESRWKHGQRVKIGGDSAFAGFIGTIMRADREDRIEVLISIFGRETPVQLDERDIEGEG